MVAALFAGAPVNRKFTRRKHVLPRPGAVRVWILKYFRKLTRRQNKNRRRIAHSGKSGRALQHLGDKLARVEQREVVDPLAGADEAGWDFQFVLDRNDDSAFAATVELGHD
jgi:hypothetical protein